jgi:S-(hydroxymethyl)glutathione dehydrogenase/alcohol dehydrogenase
VKAAVLRAIGEPLEICDVNVDKPGPREVLVRIAACGLCHSDYHFMIGDLPVQTPAILGHEVSGVVEQVGELVSAVSVGDHVVGHATVFCGHCDNCVSGDTNICSDRPKRADSVAPRVSFGGHRVAQSANLGGFAEMMLVHENGLVRLPKAMPLEKAALLGCSVITGIGSVFNAAKVHPGSRVAVVGCGGVGLNVIQGARLAGAERIIAIDLVPEKRALAKAMGATDVLDGTGDVVAAVRELTKGGVDYSFEVIGLPRTMDIAIRMLRPKGLMTVVGATPAGSTISIEGIAMLTNEWRVQGTYLGSGAATRDIPRLVSLFLQGRLDLDSLIAERIDLAGINAGFQKLLTAKQARSVVTFPDVIAQAAKAG